MRTLVDLGEDRVKELDKLSKQERKSRAALIRQAVDDYLSKQRRSAPQKRAFGLWKDVPIDGLEYQEKMRDEW